MNIVSTAHGAPKPVGPYNPAVVSGGLVFCAGQIGLHPETGTLVEGGIEAQTVRVVENLSAVLNAAGSSLNRVVMSTVFLAEIADGKVVNEIYSKFFPGPTAPARQTVAVKALPLGALVEISVIAELSTEAK